MFRFALPAALSLAVAGFGVYIGYFVTSGPAVAQTALTIVSVLCGLLLTVFVEPPTPWWTGGDVLSRDRRPALLALLLLAVFVVILALGPLREFFELVSLGPADFVVLGLVAGGWALSVRWAWRARQLDRLVSSS